jgi:hypothetical protein
MQVQGRSEVRPLDGSERQVVMSDWSEVQEIEARARRARAEWLHGALSGLVRHVRDHWVEPARRARRRRADLKVLLGLNERTLDDIGLRRSELRAASDGLIPFEQAVRQKSDAHMERVGTVVRMPTKPLPAAEARDLDTAA